MNQNLTNVRGIKCWGAHSGVKSMRRDLAIIYSDVPCNAVGTFTLNKVQAEPVKLSISHLKDKRAQVIVCNAGNANACTGRQGKEGAEAMALVTAEALGIKKEMVIVASTGLIGEPFPTEDITGGIKEIIPKLSNESKAGSFAANAILTTDTFAKEGFLDFKLDNITVNIAGIAKGSGMIHPNMATMLAFIVSDVNIDKELLSKAVSASVKNSFNMITVDGDTSTNDMVIVMANGLAKNKKIEDPESQEFKIFEKKLNEMMIHLAKLIVSDGEGSSKFIEYKVSGAKNKDNARKLVKAIADSTLVKAAMFGRDPNWGRIICACGNAGIQFNYKRADLYLGGGGSLVKVLERGKPLEFDRNYMKKLLREAHINVRLEMDYGEGEAIGWGSDLTTDYVLFNSVYTT
ncbi:MAG: bifunctional glutamate N-acetyltransferase/amino-acid acetyltransferase ArgJ [Chitinophagaceae bacterium]|nr:MAG: bifunctional glutamate N-acetyltransferase/amino-acid acetyltransferase ArgJ [Chitinophagaceae bacterium]